VLALVVWSIGCRNWTVDGGVVDVGVKTALTAAAPRRADSWSTTATRIRALRSSALFMRIFPG
jgi:hypothetical protein